MRLLVSWLREFVEIPVEPKRLGEDLTLAGLALESLETHGKDTILDLEITTNRVDCMNVYGVAREISILYGVPLKPLDLSVSESGEPATNALTVAIEAPDLCPRFGARVMDVRMGPSPSWLQERLEIVGVRPISNIVDLTNYAMLEMGHPSHAFDLARIPGGKLIVRWAREGEKLTTLDGVERTLTTRCGVVACPDGALALAGIMGGASSEVSEGTRIVALEAAYWDPLTIRRAAKQLGMHTEASHRFERGADTEGPVKAVDRIAHLLVKIGAGTVRPGRVDQHPAPRPRRFATLRPSRVSLVLGTEVPEPRCVEILRGLGFGIGDRKADGIVVEIPTWRGDVSREIDLVEEVGRHHGLHRIPATIPPARSFAGLKPSQVRERALREVLVSAGLSEVINYGFVADAAAAPESGPRVPLANPLSEEQGVLRNSLVVPGLLTSLRTNIRKGRREVGIFEIARVFRPGEPMPVEDRRVGILLAGQARTQHWSEKPRPADFFDIKGILDVVGRRLGVTLEVRRDGVELPSFLHPGKAAAIFAGTPGVNPGVPPSSRSLRDRGAGREAIGYAGALHPDLAGTWEIKDEAIVAELRLEEILTETPAPVRFRAVDRFPTVSRDLSLLCDLAISSAQIESRIREAAGERLRSIQVADRYAQPPQVPEGKFSLTVTLRYQHPERTLTSEEVQASVDQVVRALRERGIDIRGE